MGWNLDWRSALSGFLKWLGLMEQSECAKELDLCNAALAKEKAAHLESRTELIKQNDATQKALNAMTTILVNLKKDYDALLVLNESIDEQNTDLHVQIADLKSIINSTPAEAVIEASSPAFMDPDPTKAYLPYVQWSNGGIRLDPRSVYTSNFYMKSWMAQQAQNMGLNFDTKYGKALTLWNIVVNNRDYLSDAGDNWQFGPVTIAREKGDCEDGTILFVSLAMMVGFKPSEVFNVVGPTGFGYHSYPVVNFAQEDMPAGIGNAGWFIFETTLSRGTTLIRPKQLVGSVYWADSLANWQWAGIPLNDFINDFNGWPKSNPGGKMDGKKGKVENSDEKQKAIQKAWEDEGHARTEKK